MFPDTDLVIIAMLSEIRVRRGSSTTDVPLDPKQPPDPPSEPQRTEMSICYADFLICMILAAGNPAAEQKCRDDYCECFDAIFSA